MSSYVVVGASRGLGLEWVQQLSEDKSNQVFAIVRTPANATKLAELAATRTNVTVVKGDLVDPTSLKAAAVEIGRATGGKLDYLINNGAALSLAGGLTDYPSEQDLENGLISAFRTNVVGVCHATNAFLPLLRAPGGAKRIITISTGHSDPEVVLKSGFTHGADYAISKAALNMAVAQFAAALRPEGFTCVAISPGVVATADSPELVEAFKTLVPLFQKHSPHWDGVPLTPEVSVRMMRDVISKMGPEDTGAFVSHFGNKQWL